MFDLINKLNFKWQKAFVFVFVNSFKDNRIDE